MSKPAEVITRQLAPQQADDGIDALLYQPVPQLDGKPAFKVSYPWITPQQASDMLRKAATTSTFKQRPLRLSEIRRWKALIATKRFVHFLPNGVICTDEDDVLLNGQHRLNAVADGDTPCGFVMFSKVPRWMFAYFDTNRVRTIKDVFHIGQRVTGPQTASATKLALRYEEFLQGVRPGLGWRHWNLIKDEHQDVDSFLARRQELQDWYGVGDKIYRTAKLLVPSVMTFRFYQSLAWPDGDVEIQDFTEALALGKNLSPEQPSRVLRESVLNDYTNKTPILAKREVHLLLLMRSFAQTMTSARIPRLVWAYGQPMAMPYHPKGHEVAVKNVRMALDEMDAEQPVAT